MPSGEKTKLLWKNFEYRKNMVNSHKGQIAWNKTCIFMKCLKCKKVFKIKPYQKGKRKYCSVVCYGKALWLGNKAGYMAIHNWIRNKWGTPDTCKKCKKSNLNGNKIHWANISGSYKRKRNDWIRLCSSCHKKFDLKKYGNL